MTEIKIKVMKSTDTIDRIESIDRAKSIDGVNLAIEYGNGIRPPRYTEVIISSIRSDYLEKRIVKA